MNSMIDNESVLSEIPEWRKRGFHTEREAMVHDTARDLCKQFGEEGWQIFELFSERARIIDEMHYGSALSPLMTRDQLSSQHKVLTGQLDQFAFDSLMRELLAEQGIGYNSGFDQSLAFNDLY